ncbi:MAG: YfhO family protein [Clostridia bacterium]|nr:YfhO family protein [Clostridia bacterium]
MNTSSPVEAIAAAPAKRDRSYLIWTFLIPFSFMLLVYAIDKVFPFGDKTVLVLDLNAQYIGFFEALRDFVYGDASLLYSFARTLGGEMMGIYAYYLASPLSYIVALFPATYITEALLTMFVLKAGLCGLTFGIYLHSHKHAAPIETIMFSTLYALCSYALVMQHNTMWIDNLILLPLVTLGVESVVKYRRYRLFVASLALALLSNFYIGFMTCIYVLLYFFCYFYAYSSDGRNNPLHEKNHYARSFLRMAVYAALSVAIAAIILLTVVYSLSFGKTSFTDPSYIPYLQFNPLQFFAKLLPGVYDTVAPEGFPIVFCGVITLLLVPLYFLNRRFPRAERISFGVLLGVFYVSMSINSLDMLWHGGQAPNWLNFRYSFMVCFLLLVLASRAFARLSDVTTRTILSVAVVLFALIALTAAMNYEFFTTTDAALAATLLLAFTALLVGLRKYRGKARQYLAMLMLCVVLAEVLYNGITQITALHADVGMTEREEYRSYHETMGAMIDKIKEEDGGFYRTETLSHRVVNDVMELGYRGVTNSTSTLNAKTIDFLHRLGLLSTSHWSEYFGSTLALDSLLGIRYVVLPNDVWLNDIYEECLTSDQYTAYRNPYALPIAFSAATNIRDMDMALRSSPLLRQNAIIRALLGGEANDCYVPLASDFTCENALAEVLEWNGDEYHAIYSDVYLENEAAIDKGEILTDDLHAPNTAITFTTTVPQDGFLYFYIETALQNKLDMYLNGQYYGVLFGSGDDFVKGLGSFTAGTEVTVTLKMEECCYFYFPTDTIAFYMEETEETLQNLTALGENGLVLTEFDEDYFLGSITTTAERPIVQTTIPYDAGWIVTVDGVRVQTYETLNALLAFDTTPGEHTVEMIYRPTCYVVGKIVSIAGVVIFLALIVIEELWRRRVLKPASGSVIYRLLDTLFYAERVEEEPNYLSDEEMQKAEDARRPRPSAEEEEEGTEEAASTSEEREENGHGG